jgi:predicted patatin/cPLA2 family phospholipase
VIRPDVPPVVKRAERDKDKLLRLYEEGRSVMAREFDKMLAYLGLDHE